MEQQPSAAQVQASVYRPVLVRGLVAAAFGLVTVFWQQPGEREGSIATGIYLVALAAAGLLLRRRLPASLVAPRTTLVRAVAVLAVAGVVVAVLPGVGVLTTVTTIALLFTGILELIDGQRFVRFPDVAPLARDWRISGAIGILTGILLPIVAPLGSKALLGVLGGGALIMAVQLVLAALSYRHDGLRAPIDGA